MMLADLLNHRNVSELKRVVALYDGEARQSAAGQISLFADGVRKREDILKDVLNNLKYGSREQIEEAQRGAVERRKSSVLEDGTAVSGGAAGAKRTGGRGDVQPADERQGDIQPREAEGVKTSDTEFDEDSSPMVLSSNGSTTFGEINNERGLIAAPIKLSLGNSKYGLIHLEKRHGEEIRNAGFASTVEFVEYVAKNYTHIKIGENSLGDENGTYLIQKEDTHNNTLYIELSTDGSYWSVNSGGLYRKGYGKNKKEVWSASEEQNKQPVADNTLRTEDKPDNPSDPNGNVSNTSEGKGSDFAEDKQESSKKSSVQHSVEAASAEVNVTPTPAQAEAGKSSLRPRVVEELQKYDISNHRIEETARLKALDRREMQASVESMTDDELSSLREVVQMVETFEGELGLPYEEREGTILLGAVIEQEWGDRERRAKNWKKGRRGADDGGRAADDSAEDERQPAEVTAPASVDATESVQHAVEAASAEVNVTPTPAQAEAGNYKKGHVKVADLDITIENPKGSTRSGVDADGKAWSTEMKHTYGYIRGTKGKDGDHIDVYLADDMDGWDGRSVYVIDQTNADGTFDEHKVMLGFNDEQSAWEAYHKQYDTEWWEARKRAIPKMTPCPIDEFKEWLSVKTKKRKPFAEYSWVDDMLAQQREEQTIKGDGYTIAPKPYTNKQGKTLDTYLVTFDRDFSKEEMSALRAKAKADKGWYDREAKGWMLRSAEEAKAFAEEIMSKSEDEVADEAPLTIKEAKGYTSAVKKVDINGLADTLRKKGSARLSDHAEPVTTLLKKGDIVSLKGGGRYKVIRIDADHTIIESADDPTRPNIRTSIETLSPYTAEQPNQIEQPKPKKRNKWISDEDAAEFGSLMDDLRRELGGGDIVEEEGAAYGHKKSQSKNRQDLTTPPARAEVTSSSSKGIANLQKISDNLTILSKSFKGQLSHKGVITDLANAIGATHIGEGVSRYAKLNLPNGRLAEIRISNHNANAATFAERGHNEGNLSIVIKSRRSGNTFKAHPEVELTEYVYTTEAIANDGNLLSGIAESLRGLIDNGEYIDLTGKAIVNRSPDDAGILSEPSTAYGNKPKVKPMNAEVLRKGTIVTYMMMKGGLRKFSDYCEAMVDELGDAIRPHLKSLYAATQNMEEVIEAGWDEEMDDRKTVKSFDVYNFDKQDAVDIIETAQHVVDEQDSQADTENIINQLKDQRDEQRRKKADATSADTKAIASQAEATAGEVSRRAEGIRTEEETEELIERIDKHVERVNSQLAGFVIALALCHSKESRSLRNIYLCSGLFWAVYLKTGHENPPSVPNSIRVSCPVFRLRMY